MRLSVRTKKRRLLIITGEDAGAVEDSDAYVSLVGGDLTPAPEHYPYEHTVPGEEEEEDRARRNRFGFTSR